MMSIRTALPATLCAALAFALAAAPADASARSKAKPPATAPAETPEQQRARLNSEQAAAAQAGFTVQGGHIEYFGVCAECAR